MSSIAVQISKDSLPSTGFGSIIGAVTKAAQGNLFDEVVLLFEQHKWGTDPEEIIVPEYLPLCIIQDVLTLQSQGVKVSVGSKFDLPLEEKKPPVFVRPCQYHNAWYVSRWRITEPATPSPDLAYYGLNGWQKEVQGYSKPEAERIARSISNDVTIEDR